MATRFTNPFVRFFTDNAALLSGGKLYFYVDDGGTTLKNTYSDAALSVANANPVILTSSGVVPDIFLDGSYRVVLQNSSGVQIYEADNVSSGSTLVFSDWNIGTSYGAGGNNIVTGSDGVYYTSKVSPNLGNDPAGGASPAEWGPFTDSLTLSTTEGATLVGNANGGVTEVNATAKGSIVVGDGAGIPSALAVGSNGLVLTANSAEATGMEWAANANSINSETFTSSGTWTKPAGVDNIYYILVGGGGAGGGANTSLSGGGGGGGGNVEVGYIAVTDDITVTIGAGGAGSAAVNGAAGSNSTFTVGAAVTAYGGNGGSASTSPVAATAGNAGGLGHSATGGSGGGGGGAGSDGKNATQFTVTYTQPSSTTSGTAGGYSSQSSSTIAGSGGKGIHGYGGGGGGGSSLSTVGAGLDGGANGGQAAAGINASANTGGGGGGAGESGSSLAGGNGGSGVAIIYWWT